eukprot:evm.model.scf_372EXC.5 EVM.evm.TU.scf_372EXC.5   scf_372EXC:74531-78749(+)
MLHCNSESSGDPPDIPTLIDNPLSFHDDFSVVGGVPVLGLERTDSAATTSGRSHPHSRIVCHHTTRVMVSGTAHTWTAAGYEDGSLCVWDADHGRMLGIHRAHHGHALTCCWKHDGEAAKLLFCDATLHLSIIPEPSNPAALLPSETEGMSWGLWWDENATVTFGNQAVSLNSDSYSSLHGVPSFTPDGKYCCLPVGYQLGPRAHSQTDLPSVVVCLYMYDMEECPLNGSDFVPKFQVAAKDGNMTEVDEMRCMFSPQGEALFLSFGGRDSGVFSSWIWTNWRSETQGTVFPCGDSSGCPVETDFRWLGSGATGNLRFATWRPKGEGRGQRCHTQHDVSIYEIQGLSNGRGIGVNDPVFCPHLNSVDAVGVPYSCTLTCQKKIPFEGTITWCQFLSWGQVIVYVEGSRALVLWDLADETPVDVVHLKLSGVVESQEPPVLLAASPEDFQIAVAHLALNGDRHVVHVQMFVTKGMFKVMDTSASMSGGYEAGSIQLLEFGPCGRSLGMLVNHSKLLVWMLRLPFQGAATLSLPVPGLTATQARTTFLPNLERMGTEHISQRPVAPAELVFSHDGSTLAVSYRELTSAGLLVKSVEMDVWTLYGHQKSGRATSQPPLQVAWKGLHLVSLSGNGKKCAIVTQTDCNSSLAVIVWNIGEDIGRNSGKDRLEEEALTYQVIDHDGCIGEMPIAIALTGTEDEEDEVVVCNAEGALIWMQTGHKGQLHACNMEACPGAICRISSDGKRAVILKNCKTLDIWDLEERQIQSTHCIGDRSDLCAAAVASDRMFFDGCLIAYGRDHCQYLLQQMQHSTEADNNLCSQEVAFMALEDDRTILVGSNFTGLALFPRDKYCKADVLPNTSEPAQKKLLSHARSGLEFSELSYPILTVSGNGRVVAGMLEYGCVRVWTPFSTSLSLLDYCELELEQSMLQKDVTILRKLLAMHGIAILNHPGDDGMSIFLRAVEENNQEWVKAMLEWAETDGSTVRLSPLSGSTSHLNALDLAIQNRNGAMIDMILDALFNRLVKFSEAADVMSKSFLSLQTLFPRILYKRFSNNAMFLTMGKMEVSVDTFDRKENLVVGTHDGLCSHIKMDRNAWDTFGSRIVQISKSRCVWSRWKQRWEMHALQKTNESSASKTIAFCKAIPFSDIAQ